MPCSCKNLVKLPPVYSPPRSDLSRLDFDVVLCLSPCGVGFVSLQSFVFGFEELKAGVTRKIVSERYVVCASTNRSKWGWSP